MRKIILPRGGGKTDRLIRASASTGCYIVCQSQDEAHVIQSRAMELELSIPLPISFDEFIRQEYYGFRMKGFLIDNLDLLIQKIAGRVPVIAVTLTNDSLTVLE